MIHREDVTDLREGDFVEIRFASGSLMRGPLTADGYGGEPLLGIADVHWPLRLRDGGVQHYLKECTLTVVSRAPRPLYVNHPRTEPAKGDVVIDGEGVVRHVYGKPTDGSLSWWSHDYHVGWGWTYQDRPPKPLRLLVDGETGQVVTP